MTDSLFIDSCRLSGIHQLYIADPFGFQMVIAVPFSDCDSRPDPITRAWNAIDAHIKEMTH